jgi:CBS domain containing-hemolysin-like protein
MPATQISQLIPVLQTAIGPVILISGVGLLLLSLTNRFGRAVDRARQLLREMRVVSGDERKRLASQIENLYQRAALIQLAIIYGAVSVLFVAVLIITLFIGALLKIELAIFIVALFIGCLLSLVISLIAFIMDVRLSLKALKMELGREEEGAAV